MPNTRRVTVHADHRAVAVDLTLPATIELGVLIPAIVDIMDAQSAATGAAPSIGQWRLSRPGQSSLDESETLDNSDIQDGDLLILSTSYVPSPAPVVDDLCHEVAAAGRPGPGGAAVRIVGAAVFLWAAATSVTTLLMSGMHATTPAHIVTSAALACVAATAAVASRRITADPLPCVLLGLVAIAFTAAAGFLVVPGGPGAPDLLLAAAAGGAVSVLLQRVTGCGAVCFTAAATVAAVVSIAAAAAALTPSSAQLVGVAMAAAAVVLLNAAARLAILTAGLSPDMPEDDERVLTPEHCAARAERGHTLLTGLVIGFAGAASLGAAVVAWGRQPGTWVRTLAFIAVIGVALLLRARSHVESHRVAALVAFGSLTLTMTFALAVISAPRLGGWVSAVAAIAGAGALCAATPAVEARLSPVVGRGADWLEYAALAAIVPLGCWVGDLYSIVRGLSLT